MSLVFQLVGIMRRRPAETLSGFHFVEHGHLAAILGPTGHAMNPDFLAELATHGAVLPVSPACLLSLHDALLLLIGEAQELTSRLRQVAGTRQIDIALPSAGIATGLVSQLDPAPLKQLRQDTATGPVLRLLVPAAAAQTTRDSLLRITAGQDAQVSRPLPPVAFAALRVDRLSSRQRIAAEILCDISAGAPPADIRETVRQQMATPVTSLAPSLSARRGAAGRLLLHIADIRDRLSRAGQEALPEHLMLAAPQLQARRPHRRVA